VIALQLVPRDEAGFASPENVLDDLLCLDLVLHAQEDGNPFGLLIPTVGHHLTKSIFNHKVHLEHLPMALSTALLFTMI